MRHELKAVFDDRAKAQQALDELLASGYPGTDLRLASVAGMRSGSAGEAPTPRWRERSGTSTARLLSRLLGLAESRPAAPEAPPSAADSHVLTLSTDSAEEAERAVSLVSAFMRGGHEQTGFGLSAAQTGMRYVPRASTAMPGALQFAARGASHYVGAHDADDPTGTGSTWKEPMLPAGFWPGALPGVDGPTGAAFRFGRDMHEDERYRNRAWRESDAELKRLWEAGVPDRPDWQASAPAVHLGWDSTHPEIDDDSYHRSHWRTAYPDSAAAAGGRPATDSPARTVGTVDSRGHPAAPTSWKDFVDAVRHGWASTGIGHDTDENAYRLHHARTYPGTAYEDLAPVYRLGHHARARSMFRGRDWDEVEDALRAEWERGHRGSKPATWEEMKAALRAGWDRPEG